jgi:hypothetical protein
MDVRTLLTTAPDDFRIHKDGRVFFRGEFVGWDTEKTPNPPKQLRKLKSERPRRAIVRDDRYATKILAANPDYEIASAARNKDGTTTYLMRNTRNGKTFIVHTK